MLLDTLVHEVKLSETGEPSGQVTPASPERDRYIIEAPPHTEPGPSRQSYHDVYTSPALETATSGSQSSNTAASPFTRAGVDQVVRLSEKEVNTSRWSRARSVTVPFRPVSMVYAPVPENGATRRV